MDQNFFPKLISLIISLKQYETFQVLKQGLCIISSALKRSSMEDLREAWRPVLWLYHDPGKKWQVTDLNQRALRNSRGGKRELIIL